MMTIHENEMKERKYLINTRRRINELFIVRINEQEEMPTIEDLIDDRMRSLSDQFRR
jgi:hypothetical protein